MARMARFEVPEGEAWFHLHGRVAGRKGEYPLAEENAMQRLIDSMRHFAGIYFCEVAAFAVMGNHYHMVVRFEAKEQVSPTQLRTRARQLYPDAKRREEVRAWTTEELEHFRLRLYDVSEYMRSLQASFARWYNRAHERRGRFWADRFKSVYLEDAGVALDCALYVELNPVRAGLVARPEEWAGSSAHLRVEGKDSWLAPVRRLMARSRGQQSLREYLEMAYYRGDIRTETGEPAASPEVVEKEVARGFTEPGMYLERLGYFVDGIAVGSEEFIRGLVMKMREEGRYLRRKNPILQLGGVHASLREQRSNAIIF